MNQFFTGRGGGIWWDNVILALVPQMAYIFLDLQSIAVVIRRIPITCPMLLLLNEFLVMGQLSARNFCQQHTTLSTLETSLTSVIMVPPVPKERNTPPRFAPGKEDMARSTKELADQSSPQQNVDNHEPRLGPKPRSHNKVIHPPGGKSSVVFYWCPPSFSPLALSTC